MYVEKLTFLSFVKSLFYVLSNSQREKNMLDLFYFDASRTGRYLINVLRVFFPINIEKVGFKTDDFRDNEGTNQSFRINFEDLGVVFQGIIKSDEYSNLLPADSNNGSVDAFLKKSIGTTLSTGEKFEKRELHGILLLIQVVAQHMRNECQNDYSIFFIEKRCWMSALSSYSKPLGIAIVPISCIFNLKPTLSLIKAKLRAKPITCKMIHYVKSVRIPDKAGMARHLKHFDTKHSKIIVDSILSKYNASTFWSQSILPPRNVLFVSDSESYPINKCQWEDVQHAGMDVIALNPEASGSSEIPMYLPSVDKKEVYHGYTSRVCSSRERKFIRFHLDRFYYLKSYWLNLFRACNAKVYISHHRYRDKHIAIAAAMREVGGITAIWQEPYHEFSSPEALVKADLVFGFSPAVADIEKNNGSSVKYCVAIGYIGDCRFDLVRTKAQELRSSLMENGARKIIAFFDESTVKDERWGIGNSSTQADHQFILEKVLSEPWLGVILKPKKPHNLRERLGSVAEILEQAIKTGRCYIFDKNYITTPAEAALASDIAIHDNLYAGTAGLEAALAGVPTLMLDRNGWHRSRIYKLGENRVVFQEWKHLWETLMEHWNIRKIPGFGDWSSSIKEFDPFRDGKAAHRMGTYLSWLIQGYERGQDRDVILADAADKYCKQWGYDKVVQMS